MKPTMAHAHMLITVSGADQPGITAALTEVICQHGVELLDVEQVVVQGHLTLCLLTSWDDSEPSEQTLLKDLLFTAKQMGLEMHFGHLADQSVSHVGRRYVVNAIGDQIGAREISRLAQALAAHQANIQKIHRLSRTRLSSIEIAIQLEAKQVETLRKELMLLSTALNIDLALQEDTLNRRGKRLVLMDMDSTLIQIEVIDELAKMAGVEPKVAEITRKAMAGELDFEASLRARVGMLKGLPFSQAETLASRLPITEGATELLQVLRILGLKTGVISGGFQFAANALKDKLRLDYAYANELEVVDGLVTGQLCGEVLTPERKGQLLEEIAKKEGIALAQTIAIGDGANDLIMLSRSGLGIAYHPKPKLREAADTALSRGGLDRILYLLGLRWEDVQELLQASQSQQEG